MQHWFNLSDPGGDHVGNGKSCGVLQAVVLEPEKSRFTLSRLARSSKIIFA
jgi:hypothetical protein